jgi:hypothetical protein
LRAALEDEDEPAAHNDKAGEQFAREKTPMVAQLSDHHKRSVRFSKLPDG